MIKNNNSILLGLFISLFLFTSCEDSSLNKEESKEHKNIDLTDVHRPGDKEKNINDLFLIDKDDVVPPGEKD